MENSTGKMASFFKKIILKMKKKRDGGRNLYIKRDLRVNQQITVNDPYLDLNSNKLGEKILTFQIIEHLNRGWIFDYIK